MMLSKAFCFFSVWLLVLVLTGLRAQGQGEGHHESSGKGPPVFYYSDSTLTGDSVRFEVSSESFQNSQAFYDSLREMADRNYLTGLLYDFLMKGEADTSISGKSSVDKYTTPYETHRGKPIRRIHFRQVDVFRGLMDDTSSAGEQWYEDVGNWVHVPTHQSIIRENLLFGEGDALDPGLLKDNGRILRNLQYLKDARFVVNPVGEENDSVDVVVLTQDLWSKGFDVNLQSINAGEVQLFDNNFMGIGHNWQGNLIFDFFKPSNPGIETFYKVNNIQGTFIDGRLYYLNAFQDHRYGIELNRRLYSYKTRMAGGMSVFRTRTRKNIIQQDTVFQQARLDYINHDFWYGYAFPLDLGDGFFADRNRLMVSARYRNDRYYENPEVTERYNYRFHDNQMLLGKVSFSRENFYKSTLVYGFGRTEDIPVGDLFSYTFGWENDQFFRRFYSGLHVKHGEFIRNFGYLSAGIRAGGFFYQHRFEQGAIRVETDYISKLFSINDLKVRQFVSMDYTRGIRRFPEEGVSFDKSHDIRGFSHNRLLGNKKMVLKAETVGFTDIYYYGFRLALYGFLDVGFLGSEDRFILNNPVQSGFGLGMRLRNENFIFNTFQVRLGFYPSLSANQRFLFNLSGEKTYSPRGYTPEPPQVVDY